MLFLMLIGIFLLGIFFTILGGAIVFTEKGLDWMYKKGIWKEKDFVYGSGDGRWYDRYTAGLSFFVGGIMTTLAPIIVWLSQWEHIRLFMRNLFQ